VIYFVHSSSQQAATLMKKALLTILSLFASFAFGFFLNNIERVDNLLTNKINLEQEPLQALNLGAFSVSLSVRDLNVSKEFYEKLGFQAFAGSKDQNYLIMKNEDTLIGLFQGMFQGNILTFNPGWDQDGKDLPAYEDIRIIQQRLRQVGISLLSEANEKTSGPASIMLADPDGNLILVDQHR
jgi:catechol 2,3-dioxygenase-like lactoylglutathione lyase family enzyme